MGFDSSGNRVVAETPADANCFIGFHDIIPWSQDDSMVAIHRAKQNYFEMSDCDKPIDICIWKPESAKIEAVDSTAAWNFQQGSRLQWLPGKSDTIAFNAIENGNAVSVFRNVVSGDRRVLPAAIYALSPDAKISIAPNFTTLAHRWKAYGYPALSVNPLIEDPQADGLWQLDLETGKSSLFISTKRVADYQASTNEDASKSFLCHVSFSPDGSRVAFLHRYFNADGGLITRMFVTDRSARELTMLAQEKVSHFDWIDNDTVVVWTRFASGLAQIRSRGLLRSPLLAGPLRLVRHFTGRWKKKLLSEAYYKISVTDPKSRVRFGWPGLDDDGHPMVARSHRWTVTDKYPARTGLVPLILYDQDSQTCSNVQAFSYSPRSRDSDVKCDLHPRWNRTETLVAVDTCEAGNRQVRLVDVRDIVLA
jgi:hypothetical protein